MMRPLYFFWWLAAATAICLWGMIVPPSVTAADQGPLPSKTPALTQTAPGRFQFGRIEMNRTNHSLTFPAEINQREGLVEYLLVHEQGKTHESLFRTAVRPHEVHLAWLLLSSAEPAASFTNQVRWRILHDGPRGPETFAPEDFVTTNRMSLPRIICQWQYRTPLLEEGKMAAEKDGSIASLIRDDRSLAQNVGPGSENDEIWWIRTNLWPRLTGKIQFELSLTPRTSR